MALKENIREYVKTAFIKSESTSAIKKDVTTKTGTAILLSLASLILFIMNVSSQKNPFMTFSTLALFLGFGVAALLVAKWKLRLVGSIIMSLLIGFLFSAFALTQGNEGFAILWILLVPPIALNLLSFQAGFCLSLYFQIFLFVIFYSSIKEGFDVANYSETFMTRFPVLYLSDFIICMFIAVDRLYYQNKIENKTIHDSLTKMYNRTHFDDLVAKYRSEGLPHDFVVISLDVNDLKVTNDIYGHDAGDMLLKMTAESIVECFEGTDYIFRLGGDEFCVFTHSTTSVVEAQIKKFIKVSNQRKQENFYSFSASAGYASVASDPGLDIEQLIKLSDKRMYQEKNKYHSYRM